MIKFTESHEWIRVEDNVGTVGITNYAQKELGEVVHVELPSIGKQVKAGDEVAVLESTKAAADVYSPVSAEIIAINPSCLHAINNQLAETTGWLFKLKLLDHTELDTLLSQEEYQKLISF